MKEYIKIAIIIFLIVISITTIKISKKYTWENNFKTKLICEIIELVFIIFPLFKYYSDILEINK